jgi:hypothetical protein
MTATELGIDHEMLLALEKLKHGLEERGGRGELWLVNADTHERYFGCATELLGLPVLVRASIPDRQALICSRADLAYWSEHTPDPSEADNVN